MAQHSLIFGANQTPRLMRTIRELILAIDVAEKQHYPYWLEQLQQKERLYALFLEMQNPEHKQDADVCRAYCGKEKSTAYSKAKLALREELSDLLFLQRFSRQKKNGKEERYRQACRNLLLGRWLMQDNHYKASEKLLTRLTHSTDEYDTRLFAIEGLSLLRYLYAMVRGEKQKYIRAGEEIQKQLKIHEAELALSGRVEGIFFQILTKRELTDQNREVQAALQWMSQFAELEFTPLMVHHSFFIRVMNELSQNDFAGAIEACHHAIKKLKAFKGKGLTHYLRTFKLQLASCYLQLDMQDEMEETLCWLQKHTPRSGVNWIVVKELECKWQLRRGYYRESWRLARKVQQANVFSALSKSHQERWKLLEAYAYLFHTGLSGEEPETRLSIQKLLNDITELSQDKEGYNVSMLILQILFYTKFEKQDYLIDMIESLEKYIYRYLHKEKTPRLYYIMRMLLLLPRHGFNPRICRKKAVNYLERLRQSRLSRYSYEVEVVPFEKVWDFAMHLVEMPRYRRLPGCRATKVSPLRGCQGVVPMGGMR